MSEYVPDEVIAEIFARLPSKSLIRFRSLSKSWCALIDTSDFIRKHASLSPQKVLIKHWDYLGITSVEDFDTLDSEDCLPFYETPGYWKVIPEEMHGCRPDFVDSCYGVLCLFELFTVSLWNPSIRRKITLPFNSKPSFIPIRELFGFGYDPFTDDYKIFIHKKCQSIIIPESSLVYSTNTGVWHPIAVPTTFKNVGPPWGCYVNGVLHWIVEEKEMHHCIMTFDLSTEVFDMIILPEQSGTSRKLTTINGSLAVISGDDQYSFLWVRKEYNNISSWSMVHIFEGMIYDVLQVANGNFLIKLLRNPSATFPVYDDRFIVYNPVTRMQLGLIKSENFHAIGLGTYVESLVLMGKGIACKEYQPSSSSLPRLHLFEGSDDFL